jgi:hypothetical protein
MMKIPPRLMIYTRDIENIIGRKRTAAWRLMQQIRAFFNKGEKDFITVTEFCIFMNLEEGLVREYLVG